MSLRALLHTCARSLTCAATMWVLLAVSAAAHNAQYPIPAAKAVIQKKSADHPDRFSFRTARDVAFISLTGSNAHDPSTDGFKLLVTGSGANAGHSEIISLDPDRWKRLERRGELIGYRYRDNKGTRGGIRRVIYKEGQIKIRGGGKNWSWLPSEEQESIQVLIQLENEWYCSELGGRVQVNKAGHFRARDAAAPPACPSQVCGNRIVEAGEGCDDGNLNDEDGCTALCEVSTCEGESFATTFEAIQSVVFEGYGCDEALFCHGSAGNPAGDLLLLAGESYDNLVDIPADNGQASDPRVKPGEPAQSFLYQKLAAATLNTQTSGTPMPVGGALSLEHLEAVEKWIRGGAPRDLVVEGTADLLASCLPEPDPLKIRPPEPPLAGTGVQLRQTAWPLPAESEDEICIATYHDFSTVIPPSEQIPCSQVAGSDDYFGVNNPSGKCFRYQRQELSQDPQSHHSIIHIYRGQFETDYVDPNPPISIPAQFVPWTYKFDEPGNPLEGQPCDPKDLSGYEDLGYHPNCSSRVDPSIACIGWGPPDLNQFSDGGGGLGGGGGNIPAFSGSQEPYYEQQFVDGVYAVMPLQGVVVWNSHAFNLTSGDSTMNQYLNLELADPNNAQWPLRGIFESQWIFAQNTPPFGTEEVCGTWTAPKGAHVFELSSHTHIRGVLWRTWAPPNTPCAPGPACVPRGDTPIYTSTEYSDPLQLDIDPPMVLDGDNAADRTLLFCSVYDNGSGPGSPPVKRQSTSPTTPPIYIDGFPVPGSFLPGGPCPDATVACMAGPNKGQLCGGDDAFCDSEPGAGDGDCDACPGWGGVTTEDEMFILLGSFFVP